MYLVCCKYSFYLQMTHNKPLLKVYEPLLALPLCQAIVQKRNLPIKTEKKKTHNRLRVETVKDLELYSYPG